MCRGDEMYSTEVLRDVAYRYFSEKQTQEQIAGDLFCSRSTVSRMIQRCIDVGIVNISVVNSIDRVHYLERMFREKFNLEHVRICRTTDAENTKSLLSILASHYLDEIFHDEMTIGISRGRTMRGVVDAYEGKKYDNSNIVQIVGIASNENDNYEGPKIIDILREKTNGHGYYLFIPHFIENNSIREELYNISNTSQTFKKIKECEYIISGINGIEFDNPKNIWSHFIKKINEDAGDDELVGTLLGYGIDINGKIIDSEIYTKLIGNSLDFYANNSKIIVVASGEKKAKVILGALRGNLINTLIIDEMTAFLVYTLADLI